MLKQLKKAHLELKNASKETIVDILNKAKNKALKIKEIKQLYDIANAMKKAGYDPYEQMYGYWKTGQILYVTRTDDARNKIRSISIDSIREFLVLIKK